MSGSRSQPSCIWMRRSPRRLCPGRVDSGEPQALQRRADGPQSILSSLLTTRIMPASIRLDELGTHYGCNLASGNQLSFCVSSRGRPYDKPHCESVGTNRGCIWKDGQCAPRTCSNWRGRESSWAMSRKLETLLLWNLAWLVRVVRA